MRNFEIINNTNIKYQFYPIYEDYGYLKGDESISDHLFETLINNKADLYNESSDFFFLMATDHNFLLIKQYLSSPELFLRLQNEFNINHTKHNICILKISTTLCDISIVDGYIKSLSIIITVNDFLPKPLPELLNNALCFNFIYHYDVQFITQLYKNLLTVKPKVTFNKKLTVSEVQSLNKQLTPKSITYGENSTTFLYNIDINPYLI